MRCQIVLFSSSTRSWDCISGRSYSIFWSIASYKWFEFEILDSSCSSEKRYQETTWKISFLGLFWSSSIALTYQYLLMRIENLRPCIANNMKLFIYDKEEGDDKSIDELEEETCLFLKFKRHLFKKKRRIMRKIYWSFLKVLMKLVKKRRNIQFSN